MTQPALTLGCRYTNIILPYYLSYVRRLLSFISIREPHNFNKISVIVKLYCSPPFEPLVLCTASLQDYEFNILLKLLLHLSHPFIRVISCLLVGSLGFSTPVFLRNLEASASSCSTTITVIIMSSSESKRVIKQEGGASCIQNGGRRNPSKPVFQELVIVNLTLYRSENKVKVNIIRFLCC